MSSYAILKKNWRTTHVKVEDFVVHFKRATEFSFIHKLAKDFQPRNIKKYIESAFMYTMYDFLFLNDCH